MKAFWILWIFVTRKVVVNKLSDAKGFMKLGLNLDYLVGCVGVIPRPMLITNAIFRPFLAS